jgi:hypothetical protein
MARNHCQHSMRHVPPLQGRLMFCPPAARMCAGSLLTSTPPHKTAARARAPSRSARRRSSAALRARCPATAHAARHSHLCPAKGPQPRATPPCGAYQPGTYTPHRLTSIDTDPQLHARLVAVAESFTNLPANRPTAGGPAGLPAPARSATGPGLHARGSIAAATDMPERLLPQPFSFARLNIASLLSYSISRILDQSTNTIRCAQPSPAPCRAAAQKIPTREARILQPTRLLTSPFLQPTRD